MKGAGYYTYIPRAAHRDQAGSRLREAIYGSSFHTAPLGGEDPAHHEEFPRSTTVTPPIPALHFTRKPESPRLREPDSAKSISTFSSTSESGNRFGGTFHSSATDIEYHRYGAAPSKLKECLYGSGVAQVRASPATSLQDMSVDLDQMNASRLARRIPTSDDSLSLDSLGLAGDPVVGAALTLEFDLVGNANRTYKPPAISWTRESWDADGQKNEDKTIASAAGSRTYVLGLSDIGCLITARVTPYNSRGDALKTHSVTSGIVRPGSSGLRWDKDPGVVNVGEELSVNVERAYAAHVQWFSLRPSGHRLEVGRGVLRYTAQESDEHCSIRVECFGDSLCTGKVTDLPQLLMEGNLFVGQTCEVSLNKPHPSFPSGLVWESKAASGPWKKEPSYKGRTSFMIDESLAGGKLRCKLYDSTKVVISDVDSDPIGHIPLLEKLVLNGNPVVGQFLIAEPQADFYGRDGDYEYKWFRDDRVLPATAARYKCALEDRGAIIAVSVKAVNEDGVPSHTLTARAKGPVKAHDFTLPQELIPSGLFVGKVTTSPLLAMEGEAFQPLLLWRISSNGTDFTGVPLASLVLHRGQPAPPHAAHLVSEGYAKASLLPTPDDLHHVISVTAVDAAFPKHGDPTRTSFDPQDISAGKFVVSRPALVVLEPSTKQAVKQALLAGVYSVQFNGGQGELSLSNTRIKIRGARKFTSRWDASIGLEIPENREQLRVRAKKLAEPITLQVSADQRDTIALIFRAYHAMGIQQCCAPLVGNEAARDWKKGRFKTGGRSLEAVRGETSGIFFVRDCFTDSLARTEYELVRAKLGKFLWQAFVCLAHVLVA